MWSSLLSVFITFYSLVRPVFNFPFVLFSFSVSLMLASTSTARLYFLLCFQLLFLLSCCNWFTFSVCASFNCPFLFISHFSLQHSTISRLLCAFLTSPSFHCCLFFAVYDPLTLCFLISLFYYLPTPLLKPSLSSCFLFIIWFAL